MNPELKRENLKRAVDLKNKMGDLPFDDQCEVLEIMEDMITYTGGTPLVEAAEIEPAPPHYHPTTSTQRSRKFRRRQQSSIMKQARDTVKEMGLPPSALIELSGTSYIINEGKKIWSFYGSTGRKVRVGPMAMAQHGGMNKLYGELGMSRIRSEPYRKRASEWIRKAATARINAGEQEYTLSKRWNINPGTLYGVLHGRTNRLSVSPSIRTLLYVSSAEKTDVISILTNKV